MRNPFRKPAYRAAYDDLLAGYDRRCRVLFLPDGTECHGNSVAHWFWLGYHGFRAPNWFTTRVDRDTFAYVQYLAGVACAARNGA